MNAPYLKVTLYDNDYMSYWQELGEAIQSIICFECNDFEDKTVEEIDLEVIKPYIAKLWWGMDSLSSYFRWKNTLSDQSPTRPEYFDDVKLSIVDYSDIPEWDNGESIFIPLFESSDEIIFR